MNLEYFRQKQMRCEQCFKQVNIGTVVLVVGVSVLVLGIITFIVFTLDGINVFTEEALPAAFNPITLIVVSLMFIVIVLYDKKIIGKKGDIDKYAILYR
jgi:magnesium-transporting ATPase (P-type)